MKIIRTLKITPEEFFGYLADGILADIARANGEDVPAPDRSVLASGLAYVKEPDNQYRRMDVTVTAFEDGRLYEARMESMADTVEVRYTVEPDPKGIRVVFEQSLASFDGKRRGPLRSFSEAVYLGRMAEQLLDIQEKVLDARAGIVRPAAPPQREHKLVKKLVEKMERE